MTDFANWRLGSGLWTASTVTFQNHTVDATTDGIAFDIQARDANPITHIGFRYGARTGTPPVFVATLESKSAATGFPDGTDIGAGSPTAVTFTPPADATWDGTWQWVTLTNAYTPTRGQLLMATIRYSSGTIDASNLSTFTTHSSTLNAPSSWRMPNSYRLTAGTWAQQQAMPIGGLRTASSRYGLIVEGAYNTRSASTVGHRQAIKFTLPAAIANTKTLKGVRFTGSIAAALAKNPIAKLWSDSAALQDFTLDSDWYGAAASYQVFEVYFDETTLSALTWGTAYYIGFEVADAVNGGVLINGLQLDNASDLSAYGGGSNACLSTYNGSSWTDDTTVYPFFELILDDITGNSGSGGVVYPRAMSGGFV